MKIIVIGGGIAGCSLALKLANAGHIVTLLEIKEELLNGSSDNTPCRLGMGFHYAADKRTAIKYLHSTLAFVKEHGSKYIVGHSESIEHPLRRGRYFIVNDSIFPHEKVLSTFEAIKAEYSNLVEADPSNAVFGDPEKFYNILTLNKYSNLVNTDVVTVGIETAEQILDWQKFKVDFIHQIRNHKNITVKTSTAVKLIKDSTSDGFVVTAKQGSQIVEEKADFVINAAWQNAEALGYQSGYKPTECTKRLKVIIEVKLPKVLINANPMFFCFGPHCAFNNIGNGKGFISYEPVTNIAKTNDIFFPKELQKYLDGDVSVEKKNDLASKIIAGTAKYIPSMAEAEFTGTIKFGIVKTYGNEASISDPHSSIHQRRESGVEEDQVGVIKNSAMKLLYGNSNANEVIQIIQKHCEINEEIKNIAEEVFPLTGKSNTHNFVLNHALSKTMQRYWILNGHEYNDSKKFEAAKFSTTKLKKIIASKQVVSEKLKEFFKSSPNSSISEETDSDNEQAQTPYLTI